MQIGCGDVPSILDLVAQLDESTPGSPSAVLVEHPRSIGTCRLVLRIQNEGHPPYFRSKGGGHKITDEVENLGGKQARDTYQKQFQLEAYGLTPTRRATVFRLPAPSGAGCFRRTIKAR
jgi:hypothetical protein